MNEDRSQVSSAFWSCKPCELLSELYRRTPESDRDYWLMTELFVLLHGGRDYCKGEKDED